MSENKSDKSKLIESTSNKIGELIYKELEKLEPQDIIEIGVIIIATVLKTFIKVASVHNKEPFDAQHVEHILFTEFLKQYFEIWSVYDSINPKETTNEN